MPVPLEGGLQPLGVHRAGGDLEIDLDVDVGGAGVAPTGARAQQFWNETADQHEAWRFSIVVHDADQSALDGCSGDS